MRSPVTDGELGEAYRTYGGLIARRCRYLLRDDAAGQDAVQEVFLRLWKYGQSYRDAESKLSWLYRVAERVCFDRMRSTRRRDEVPLDGSDARDAAEPPSELPARLAERDTVLRFLSRFDDRVKQIAVLHYLEGATQEEIATAIGWSRQTVAKKLALLRSSATAFTSMETG
jgi:RNA polymerase sigma-70 factor (ECF subfamily)